MPGHRWTDKARYDFLTESIPGYEAAQEHNNTRSYLADLHERYFKKFPQQDEVLMAAEKKQVSSWLNNYSGGRGQKTGTLRRATRVTFRGLLRGKLEQKRRQKLQPVQAYSELYYTSKWKETIDAEWEVKLQEEPELQKKNKLAFRNMCMLQFFQDESDDVKAEVEHYRNTLPTENSDSPSMLLPGEDELDDSEQSRRIAAREKQFAIDNAEAVLTEVAKDLEDATGLKSHFLLAGPEPKRNGRMVMFTITAGKTVAHNQGFKTHHPTYKSDVHEKFKMFAKACFTLQDREKLANVPFNDSQVPTSTEPSSVDPASALPNSIPSVSQKTTSGKKRPARKRTTADKRTRIDDATSEVPLSSNTNIEKPEDSTLDEARHTVNAIDEDAMDVFSPELPPNRLIVDSKEVAGGLTLYKTAEGEWLSEIELERLANIARNSRLLTELGLDDARRSLATRPQGEDKEPEIEDDREFSVARTRAAFPPRERRPRLSKKDISYVEKGVDDIENELDTDSISVSESAPQAVGEAITGATVTTATVTISDSDPGSGKSLQPVSGNVLETVNSVPVNVLPASTVDVTSPVSSTSSSPLIDSAPVQVNDHASLTTHTEVNNHASLGLTSSPIECAPRPNVSQGAIPSDNLLATPIHPVDINSVDFSKVPAWLCRPLMHLQNEFRGELEDKILGAYVALEMAWQPFDKRIGTVNRPESVSWWIKNARPVDRVPPSIDLASFPTEVRNWWTTIQPGWRTPIVEDWPLPQQIPPGECWAEASLGGSNGLFLILLCLYWWRRSAEETSDSIALAEYQSVAEDVIFVLDAILQNGLSQASQPPLTGSARANARSSTKRKATAQTPEQSNVKARTLRSTGDKSNMKPRTLRSSGEQENTKPSRARRSRT